MGLMIAPEPAPLDATPDGVVRVGGTRVTLDTVVAAFLEGATAEEIAYPVLALADVYAAIGYYWGRGQTPVPPVFPPKIMPMPENVPSALQFRKRQ